MKNKVIYNLQIARGISTLLVVIAHSTMFLGQHVFYGVFAIGRCGVDFFFIISGFVIYYTNQNLVENLPQLNKYLLRRLTRVYPVHWISLSAILLFYYSLSVFDIYDYSFKCPLVIKSFLLWPTYLEGMPVNPVTWTLSHEVFFYILFGIAIAIGKRFSIALFSLWFLISLTSLNFEYNNAFLHMLTSTKNIEFIYGCLIAIYINKFEFSKKIYLTIFCSGAFLIACSWYYVWERSFIEDGKFDFIFSGIPCAFVVYSLIKLENKAINKLKKAFVFVGDAAYSIYLNHFTVMAFLFYFTNRLVTNKIIMFVFSNAVCLSFGILFYLIVEKPVTNFFRKLIDYKYSRKNSTEFQRIDSQLNSVSAKL